MEIRIRATGQVMYENELRAYLAANNGPSYDQLTPEVMEAVGVDPVLEGPAATCLFWQFSQRDGVEQINGQWFTKHIAGPVFTNPAAQTAYIATKTAEAAKTLQNSIVTATQARLDTFAKERNYDGILSACTYAASAVASFSAEGQRCVNLRDQTWAALYTLLGKVQAGTHPTPTSFADVEPLLPVLTWAA
jgi:hypothetical protein